MDTKAKFDPSTPGWAAVLGREVNSILAALSLGVSGFICTRLAFPDAGGLDLHKL